MDTLAERSVNILDTASCERVGRELNDWDNDHYPEDLRVEYAVVRKWVDRSCFVCASAVDGKGDFEAILSFLITAPEESAHLVAGRIHERDLQGLGQTKCEAVLYLASFILLQEKLAVPVVRSALREVEKRLSASECWSSRIMCVIADVRTMDFWQRHGFVEAGKYHGQYPIMEYKGGAGTFLDQFLASV